MRTGTRESQAMSALLKLRCGTSRISMPEALIALAVFHTPKILFQPRLSFKIISETSFIGLKISSVCGRVITTILASGNSLAVFWISGVVSTLSPMNEVWKIPILFTFLPAKLASSYAQSPSLGSLYLISMPHGLSASKYFSRVCFSSTGEVLWNFTNIRRATEFLS